MSIAHTADEIAYPGTAGKPMGRFSLSPIATSAATIFLRTERRHRTRISNRFDRRPPGPPTRCLLAIAFFVAIAWGGVPRDGHSGRARGDDVPRYPLAGMGILVGEVTESSALVQVRLTRSDWPIDGVLPGATGTVAFTLIPLDRQATDLPETRSMRVPATPDRDHIARASFGGLRPNTRYACVTEISPSGGRPGRPGPTARFRTLAGRDAATTIDFVVVTGMNYAKFHGDDRIDRERHLFQNNTELPPPYDGPDKPLGYPALKTILELRPDFFVGTGDNVYYDTPDEPRARTREEMRQKWHQQFVQPRFRDLFAVVPTYWEIDDHDYRYDDSDNAGDEPPSPALAQAVMLEQLPYGPADASPDEVKTYRTHRVNRDLQIWLTENRIYRSPNAMPDGPDKTIWGAEQRDWLQRTLLESDAAFKVIISPTPMVGPDDARKTDNHVNHGGFRHERDQFFRWVKRHALDEQGLVIVCGDRHWQYHAVDPSGIEEFSCGALVDANSRLGRRPGDPQSTDPDATIRQLYSQDPRSGGFLHLRVTPAGDGRPATLTFFFRDTRGELLYEHSRNR